MPRRKRTVPLKTVPEPGGPSPEREKAPSRRYNKKRGRSKWPHTRGPPPKKQTTRPPPAPTDQRIALRFVQHVDFQWLTYVPDLGGLLELAHSVWVRLATMRSSANVVQSFSEPMFIMSVAQTAFQALALKCRHSGTLPESYRKTWFLSWLSDLAGRRVPKFLADWIAMIGSFTGPTGATFVPTLPEFKADSEAYFFDERYTSSFPSFRLLARVLANSAKNRPWNDFRRDPDAAAGHDNPDLVEQDVVCLIPGLGAAMMGARASLRDRVRNFNDDWEYLPRAGVAPSLRHLLQLPARTSAHIYMGRVFDRCADEGMPTVTLTADMLEEKGTEALQYYIEPEDRAQWNVFRVTTLKGYIDPVHAETACLFKPIIAKKRSQIVFDGEAENRWHPCLVNADVAALTTNFFHKETYLRDAMEQYVTPAP